MEQCFCMVKKYKSGFSFRLRNEKLYSKKHTTKNNLSPRGTKSNLNNPPLYGCVNIRESVADSKNRKKNNRSIRIFRFKRVKAHHTFSRTDLILTITRTLLCIRCRASLTVEAAMVAPFFVFFIVLFLGFFRVLQVENQVDQALSYTVSKLAVETISTSDGENTEDGTDDLINAGIWLVNYGKEKLQERLIFVNQLKEQECSESYVAGGYKGITLSDKESDEQYVRLIATYDILLPVNLFGKESLEVTQVSVARRWTGYCEETAGNNQWVYITPFGTVYHTRTDCSYLGLSVWAVSTEQVQTLKNANGGKYYQCAACKNGKDAPMRDTVYVTDYGTLYHNSLECKALKRTVFRVTIDKAEGRNLCQKCK